MNNFYKVENMDSPKTGRPVANQYIIDTPVGRYFQSYRSIIVYLPNGTKGAIQLDKTYWNYSRTTSKYRNIFMNETTEETKKKIKSGEYILTDLND